MTITRRRVDNGITGHWQIKTDQAGELRELFKQVGSYSLDTVLEEAETIARGYLAEIGVLEMVTTPNSASNAVSRVEPETTAWYAAKMLNSAAAIRGHRERGNLANVALCAYELGIFRTSLRAKLFGR